MIGHAGQFKRVYRPVLVRKIGPRPLPKIRRRKVGRDFRTPLAVEHRSVDLPRNVKPVHHDVMPPFS